MIDPKELAQQMKREVQLAYIANGLRVPEQFLADITTGCAPAFIEALTKLARGVGRGIGGASGTVKGMEGVSVATMVIAGRAYMVHKSGSESPHLKFLLEGLYRPLVRALSEVVTTSVSGHGGTISSIVGLDIGPVSHLILYHVPEISRPDLLGSKASVILVDSIANGFCVGLRQGKPPAIPICNGRDGNLVVKFS